MTEAWLFVHVVCPPENMKLPDPALAMPPPLPEVARLPENVVIPMKYMFPAPVR